MKETSISNKGRSGLGKFLIKYNTYIMLLVLIIICTSISTDFFTADNWINIGRQYSGTIIVCMGMLFVILTGGIDLSVGSIQAVSYTHLDVYKRQGKISITCPQCGNKFIKKT